MQDKPLLTSEVARLEAEMSNLVILGESPSSHRLLALAMTAKDYKERIAGGETHLTEEYPHERDGWDAQ